MILHPFIRFLIMLGGNDLKYFNYRLVTVKMRLFHSFLKDVIKSSMASLISFNLYKLNGISHSHPIDQCIPFQGL